MDTRDHVRPAAKKAADVWNGRLLDGMGRTTLLAVTAIAGCLLLIACGATVSMCWMVHPLLSAVAGVGLAWLIARLAGRLFWCRARSR